MIAPDVLASASADWLRGTIILQSQIIAAQDRYTHALRRQYCVTVDQISQVATAFRAVADERNELLDDLVFCKAELTYLLREMPYARENQRLRFENHQLRLRLADAGRNRRETKKETERAQA